MKIIFVRHGKDDDRYRGGWSQLDLIPEGIEQAKRLANHLKENQDEYHITRIISSDLQRTVTTANYISAELGISVQVDERLREMNNGVLAGMLNEKASEQYPGLFFSSLKMDESYPNGESPNDFYLRIKRWFEEFSVICPNEKGNILVVTHGGVVNIIYHLVNRIEWNNKRSSFKVSNCSVHILDMNKMKFEIENRIDFISK